MKTTTNFGLKKPDENDFYNVTDQNDNMDVIDRVMQEYKDGTQTVGNAENLGGKPADYYVTGDHKHSVSDIEDFPSTMPPSNHTHSASDVGLGNVPNVSTNNQTPTYTVAGSNAELTSGEKLSVAFGKIAKAIKSLIAHLADTTSHVTSTERSTWNGKANASHGNHVPTTQTASNKVFLRNDNTWQTVTPANIGAAASSHNQSASTITAGTFKGDVAAPASTAFSTAHMTNHVIVDTKPTVGDASTFPIGTYIHVKK